MPVREKERRTEGGRREKKEGRKRITYGHKFISEIIRVDGLA
jgi:hypothetical protein